MARKPRAAQGVPAIENEATAEDTPAVARRGRQPKPPMSVPAAQDTVELVAAPVRRRPGPKPKPQDTPPPPDAAGKRGRKPRLAKPDVGSSAAPDEAMQAEAADHPNEPDGGEPMRPAAAPEQASAGKPAAQWDQPTDTVRFDWPEIESTAAQPGPNQVMAKLLIAARAEGANSRWPL